MVYLFFATTDLMGVVEECSFSSKNMETGFEVLIDLVKGGFQLTEVYLSDSPRNLTPLPVKAFDGVQMTEDMKNLQKEWELALNED